MLDEGVATSSMLDDVVESADGARPAALPVLTEGGLVAVTRSLRLVAPHPVCGRRRIARHDQGAGADESSSTGMSTFPPVGRISEIEDLVDGVLYLESAPS